MEVEVKLHRPEPRKCPDCQADPGRQHNPGCDVERCSICGQQAISCGHNTVNQDHGFSRWTGWWPGEIECQFLDLVTPEGPDLNRFYSEGHYKLFFVKPV